MKSSDLFYILQRVLYPVVSGCGIVFITMPRRCLKETTKQLSLVDDYKDNLELGGVF